MSQVPPSNDPVYGSQPYGQGSPHSSSSAPSAPYAQGGSGPYGQEPYGQGGPDPYAQQAGPGPYAQQAGPGPYAQQAGPGPYAQQAGPDPYAQQAGPDPYAQQGAMAPGYGANNPYDPSFSYTGAGGVSIPAPKGKKGPVILLSVALVLVISAVAVFIGSLVMITNISGTLTPVQSNGEVTADLKTDTLYALYSEGDPSCTVTAPDGSNVMLITAADNSTVEIDNHTVVATFIPDQTGKYTINCTTPGSEDVHIGQALNTDNLLGGALGIVIAGGLAIVGTPMLIGAIIWLVVRLSYNKKARQAQAAMGGGHPGGQQWQQY